MAIAGNSPRKSKARHNEKETNDVAGGDIDQENEENELAKNHPEALATGIVDTPLELLEKDIIFAEESLQKFLISAVAESNSKVYDVISKHGQKLTFRPNKAILRNGITGSGIYILLEGNVNVRTSDESAVFNTLSAGEVFGEISTLFDIPVTANISSASDVTLIKLSKQATLKLFQDCLQDLDIIDWFIQRRYFPTGSTVDSRRVYRRLALNTLKRIHLFNIWTEEMIKKLILSFEHNILTLYPEKSVIVLENDPLTSLYVVLKGEIEIKQASRIVKNILITETDPFVYTELALIVEGKISPVTIKALTNCQIIQLRKEWVLKVLESFPEYSESFSDVARLFRSSFKRLGSVYLKNEAYLQIEMLCYYLKRSHLYASSDVSQLWRRILNCDLLEFEEVSSGVFEVERKKYESVVVARGEVMRIQAGDLIDSVVFPKAADGSESGRTDIKYEPDKSAAGLDIGNDKSEQDEDGNKHVFAAGTVVDLKTFAEQSVYFKAKPPCVVLKLRTCDTVTNTDVLPKAVPEEKVKSDDALDMV